MASDFRKVIRDHIGGDPVMVDAVVNAHDADLDELRQRIHHLQNECWHLQADKAELRADRYRLVAFLRSFLNPEERGNAVPAHVRDDVREVLGRHRVETTGEEPKR